MPASTRCLPAKCEDFHEKGISVTLFLQEAGLGGDALADVDIYARACPPRAHMHMVGISSKCGALPPLGMSSPP